VPAGLSSTCHPVTPGKHSGIFTKGFLNAFANLGFEPLLAKIALKSISWFFCFHPGLSIFAIWRRYCFSIFTERSAYKKLLQLLFKPSCNAIKQPTTPPHYQKANQSFILSKIHLGMIEANTPFTRGHVMP
jgi:hypothetical protein